MKKKKIFVAWRRYEMGNVIGDGERYFFGFLDIHSVIFIQSYMYSILRAFDIHTIFFVHMYFSRRYHTTINSCREAVIYPFLQSKAYIPASQLPNCEKKSKRISKPFRTLPLESQSPSASPTPPDPHQHRYPSARFPRSYR